MHLALVFKAGKQASARQTPFAFGLVLDNSGSMAGKPLEYAKSAATMVLKHLRDDDRFGLVVFSDSARTVVPLQVAKDKARLQALIADIREESSTNLTAGWMLGRDELAKTPAEIPRKLLLLTDGHLNQGIVEPAQVRQIVASGLEKERIRTACLGFGDGYNEDLLDELSKAASGALHDAASPEKFPAIFRQELESLFALSAQNLRVRIRKLHYCSGLGLLSDYPVVTLPEGGIEIMVGNLVSEEQRVFVLALEVLPIPPLADGTPAASIEGEALLEIELAYDEITEGGITSKTEQRTIRLVAVQDPAEVRVNAQAVEWVAAQEVGRTISEAIAERDRGNIDAVRRRLKATKDKLGRYGCAESTSQAMENLNAFEEASAEWGSRARKTSRTFSNRTRRSSSYYEAGPLGDQSGHQPPQPPTPPQPHQHRLNFAVAASAVVLAGYWLSLIERLRLTWETNSQYAYGWFVPFLAAYLFWIRWPSRPESRPASGEPLLLAGAGFLAVGFWIARFIHESNPEGTALTWLMAFQVVGLSFLAIVAASGFSNPRHFAFPVCFSLVAVPWPLRLEMPLTQHLMQLLSHLVVELLNWSGVSAVSQGNLIQLDIGVVGVDEAGPVAAVDVDGVALPRGIAASFSTGARRASRGRPWAGRLLQYFAGTRSRRDRPAFGPHGAIRMA